MKPKNPKRLVITVEDAQLIVDMYQELAIRQHVADERPKTGEEEKRFCKELNLVERCLPLIGETGPRLVDRMQRAILRAATCKLCSVKANIALEKSWVSFRKNVKPRRAVKGAKSCR